jgi:hypothetical protein
MTTGATGGRLEDLARGWLGGGRRRSRLGRRLGFGARALALVLSGVLAVVLVRPIVRHRLPPLEGARVDGTRYGLTIAVRKQIYGEMAKGEASAAQKGKEGFPDDPWSAQDHAASFERDTVRDVAGRHKISLTAAYLILDEGMHERWPVPRARPLDGSIVPLHPRRTW